MPSFAHQEINQDSGSKRTPPVPPIPLEIKQISERLVKIKNENSAEDASANEIIRRMKALRADLQDTLGSCHKTMETSSHCLEDYFRHIAPAQLFQHVSARFSHFDKDHDGSLDRDEVREAMAEMGQRPTEQELDEFFALFDKVRTSDWCLCVCLCVKMMVCPQHCLPLPFFPFPLSLLPFFSPLRPPLIHDTRSSLSRCPPSLGPPTSRSCSRSCTLTVLTHPAGHERTHQSWGVR
mmetsp:Transcript_45258/g.92374  ORF Transcript_45258/g.92374 Transcript_45258/m.92374 type:complete len:237 (+) Transcript_45258:178-888(+)